jgi:hypothetical protein
VCVTNIQEIEQAIARLPRADFFQLVRHLRERHGNEWDRQIQADSESGSLDFLLREVEDEIVSGKTRPADELLDDQ